MSEQNWRILMSADQLNYTKIIDPESEEKLIPAIVVDTSQFSIDSMRGMLMVGFANKEAIEKTLATGLVTFFSRSQGGLWTKGETSGNVLSLREAYIDCDADTVLFDAEPAGPTCHTGADSCFEQFLAEIVIQSEERNE